MPASRKKLIETARKAFVEGYESCFKARARAAAGFDIKDADEAWRASKTYRALTKSDGGEH